MLYDILGQAANCMLSVHYLIIQKWLRIGVCARRAEKAEEANSSSAGSGCESLGAYHPGGTAVSFRSVPSLVTGRQRDGFPPLFVMSANFTQWGDIETLAERLRDEAVSQRGMQVLPFLIGV